MMAIRSISALAIPVIINVDAGMSFLPRRYSRLALKIIQPAACIIDLRGGNFDDVNNVATEATEHGYEKAIGPDTTTTSEESDSNHSFQELVDEDEEHSPHGYEKVIGPDTTTTSEESYSNHSYKEVDEDEEHSPHGYEKVIGPDTTTSEESMDSNHSYKEVDEDEEHSPQPWEEEIRRTRAFYSTPRLSSQTDKILITGTTTSSAPADSGNVADSEKVEEREVAVEDERAFGNAHPMIYNLEDKEENYSEQTEQLEKLETDTAHLDHSDTEEGAAVDQQSSVPMSEYTSEMDADVSTQDALDGSESKKDEDNSIQKSDETTIQDKTSALLDSNDFTEVSEIISEEKGSRIEGETPVVDEEDRPLNMEEEVAVGSSNTIEVESEDMVTKESEDTDIVLDDTAGMDENGELEDSVIGAENKESQPEEDYRDDSIVQEISPVPTVDIKEEDLRLPHRWEKATKATASNKLVEEGLRRLQRRDGDVPSVPYVITRAMQRVLVDELGYEPLEVKAMRPDVAVVIVGESLERPDLESLPSRFYSHGDAELNVAVEEIADDKSLKETAAAALHMIQRKISSSFVGRHREIMPIVVASLGVTLSFLFGSKHSKESGGGATPILTSDIPPIIEVPSDTSSELSDIEDDLVESDDDDAPSTPELQPDDLDKTWLDKIISFVSASMSGTH